MRLLALLAAALLSACKPEPVEPAKPSISYKTRAENAQVRVEKSHRLSETETVKVITVPGYPMGERCVVYNNGPASAMQCRELSPTRQ